MDNNNDKEILLQTVTNIQQEIVNKDKPITITNNDIQKNSTNVNTEITKMLIRGTSINQNNDTKESIKNISPMLKTSGNVAKDTIKDTNLDQCYTITEQTVFDKLYYLCHVKYPKKKIELSENVLISISRQIFDSIPTLTLEYLYYETASLFCIAKELENTDYEVLAKRLLVEGLETCCGTDLKTTINNLYFNGRSDSSAQKKICGIRNDTYVFVMRNIDILQNVIINENNDKFTYFGLKSMVGSYLIKSVKNQNIPIESPQLCYMRIAADIMGPDDPKLITGTQGIIEIYKLFSQHKLISPSPHYFGVGQYASCFLVECGEDTLKAITRSKNQLTDISKGGGGVGLSIDRLRASNRPITSTGGRTSGLVGYSKNLDKHNIFDKRFEEEENINDQDYEQMIDNYISEKRLNNSSTSNANNMKLLKSFDSSSTYIDQGKRRATYAIYISTHHSDFEESIKLKDPTLPDDLRTLNLYYGAWNSDLLMERVRKDELWSFFSPDIAPGLHTLWGTHFQAVYELYESKKLYSFQKRARDFWKMIMESIMGFSACYLMYKDACNRYCNESEDIPSKYNDDHFKYWIDYERDHEIKCRNTTQFHSSFEPDIEPDINTIGDQSNYFYIDKIFDQKSKERVYSRIKELEQPNIEKRTRNINYDYDNILQSIKVILRQGGFADVRLANLCTEILAKVNGTQDESKSEIGVCNLSSINLSKTTKKIKDKNGQNMHVFDYDELFRVAKLATLYINRSIDRTLFPNAPSKLYSQKRRSIGLGAAGLSTLCSKLKLSIYEDVEQVDLLNFQIFETMYYSSLKESNRLAKERGAPYETFRDSPLSKGLFIFDLYDGFQKYKQYIEKIGKTVNWDFDSLRKDIVTDGVGVINSQNLCIMPGASSCSVLDISENVEPPTSNILVRNIISGSFLTLNPQLLKMLKKNKLWNKDIYSKIVENKGNIRNIKEIPNDIRRLFPTVWENTRNLKRICDLYIGRQWFISNAQSLNLYGFHGEDNFPKAVLYLWQNEAKNGVYYYRTKRTLPTQQFSVNISTHEERLKLKNSSSSEEKDNNTQITNVPLLFNNVSRIEKCNQEVCFSCQ